MDAAPAHLLCRGAFFATVGGWMIRVVLIHVPVLDDDASEAVRGVFRNAAISLAVVTESATGSQRNWLAEVLRRWCDEEEIDLILTIGGTLPAPGPSAAECVPEATLDVLERQMPGLSEAMRAEVSMEWPQALLDRGISGIRGRTLIVNLPEGAASALFLAAIVDLLPDCIAHLQGDPSAQRLAMIGRNAIEPAPASSDDKFTNPSSRRGTSALNADEFAAYLQRRSSATSGDPES